VRLTAEGVTDQLNVFKNEDEKVTLEHLRGLTRVKRRMRDLADTQGLERDEVSGEYRFSSQAQAMLDAVVNKTDSKREALDAKVAKWFREAREEAKSLIAGDRPTSVEEKLLYQTTLGNFRAEFEPHFRAKTELREDHSHHILTRYREIKRHEDPLTQRAAYDAVQALHAAYPDALDFPGLDLTVLDEAPPGRSSEETLAGEKLLDAVDEAEAEWYRFAERRAKQHDYALGLMLNEHLVDLAEVFRDHRLSPLERIAKVGDSVPPEYLLLAQELVS